MLDAIIVFCIVLIGTRIAAHFDKESKEAQVPKECKPHSWTYNQDDKLQCTECNFISGN